MSIATAGKELSSVELLSDTDTVMQESKDTDSMQDSPSLVTVPQLWFAVDRKELWMQDEATYYFGNDSESVVPIEAARVCRHFDREELWIQDEATYYFCKVLPNHPGCLTAFDVRTRNQDSKNIFSDLPVRKELIHKESMELKIPVVVPQEVLAIAIVTLRGSATW